MTHSFNSKRRALIQNLCKTSAALSSMCMSLSLSANVLAQTKQTPETGMKIVLLGTAGGPTPKKNRAAPSQVVIVDGVSYVVDCGNGVAQQMVKANLKLSSIEHIFLTHHHSDHNADYGNLMLLSWAADLDHRIDTYGPPPLKKMTQQFLALNDFDIKTRIKDEGRRPLSNMIFPHELIRGGVVMQNDKVKVTATLVVHPPVTPAFAYRFDANGKSIVISGDTAPSENLIKLAQGADVLVHEVMHTPSLDKLLGTEPHAIKLKDHLLASHTTCEQLGQLATRAKVKKLVLSHFVPGGYPYLEDKVWYDAVRAHFDGEIIVGSDLMEIVV